MSLDTACSSSLTAAHLACQSLKLGEVSMVSKPSFALFIVTHDKRQAIVGGCNLFYNPDTVIPLTSLGFLSPEGRCYSFDHRANGYSRREGFGIMILKRIPDAIRDDDTIRAVIRSTVSNQDGKSPGITQPTRSAQVNLIRHAYESAGLDFASTRYFEAHGTGTPVGDPIEASAISSVFTKYRSPENPIYIGALKSNIGHLEGAAGIAGLLKSVFVLERSIIPPNCWFEKPNPKIHADEWNSKFPTTSVVWPNRGPRRASINAFGYGGSNAHVVMEDALSYLTMHNREGRHRTIDIPKLDLRLMRDLIQEPDDNMNGVQNTIESASPASKVIEFIGAMDVLDGLTDSTTTTGAPLTRAHVANKPANGLKGEYETNRNCRMLANAGSSSLPAFPQTVSGLGISVDLRERIFVLSSFDEAGVQRLAHAYRNHLLRKSSKLENENTYLDDLSYTLACKRTSFVWRTSIIASSTSSLAQALESHPKPVRSGSNARVGFVFTGQGAQWYAMGRELLDYPVFRQSLVDAGSYLIQLRCPWNLMGRISPSVHA